MKPIKVEVYTKSRNYGGTMIDVVSREHILGFWEHRAVVVNCYGHLCVEDFECIRCVVSHCKEFNN